MSVTVVKFGGSSLADAAQFRKVASIIQADDARRYVVPSAPGKRFSGDRKITDLLYQCYDDVQAGADFDNAFSPIRERFDGIVADLGLAVDLSGEYAEMKRKFSRIGARDFAASRGEHLNGILLAAFLDIPFVDASTVIFFDETGRMDDERTYAALQKMAEETPRAVIPGFYGLGADGEVKTFSRGGSDITGAIVARGVGASLYEKTR